MTIPKLTDDAVSRLPLAAGRAELLEEIMSTVAPDRQQTEPTPLPERGRRRWLVPLAAAAVVAGIAGSSLWWQQQGPGDGGGSDPAASQLGLEGDQEIVLDAPGWKVDSLGGDGLMYRKGDANLEITSYDAKDYDSYVTDREHIVDPPAPGAPIVVLGRPAQMWAYSSTDHAAIREVEGGRWLELRAQGVDEAGYLALLDQLRVVSAADFESSLPAGYVTKAERTARAQQILAAITAVSGADFPSGKVVSFEDGEAVDLYQFGAQVAGAYTCAWVEDFENAATHGQTAEAAEAARVLGTSRQWPILREMDAAGDYPEVVWDYAAEIATGQVPDGYREGLGCP